jgi:DNA helicase HerA-like ATPase
MSAAIALGAAKGGPVELALAFANRHGLIAGATGTGKTATLRVLAEGFSKAGVPVILADVKGDLSGLCRPAEASAKLQARAKETGAADWRPAAQPVVFWDVFGEAGHPLRATVSELGPVLLARMLELTEAQEGALNIAFRIADDQGLLLLDLKDLRALLELIGNQGTKLGADYGTVAKTSVGAIQRRLLVLEQQGAGQFFGEPALALDDLMLKAPDGRGAINVLAAEKLFQAPRLYATLLLWLLAELFEELPEVGDVEKPKLVFFFDEAHLLFTDAPKALVEKVEQVVRLIRSKGVGVYFVSQNPMDISDRVLGQLGNRVQHALRAFTPKDQKAVRAAAETLPPAKGLDPARAIGELEVGEALVSTLSGRGAPSPVARVRIRPPASRLAPIASAERAAEIAKSPLAGRYDQAIDRESAHEILTGRRGGAAAPETVSADPWGGTAKPASVPTSALRRDSALEGILGERGSRGGGRRGREGLGEAFAKSVARSIGSQVGRQIVRGVLGAILKGR